MTLNVEDSCCIHTSASAQSTWQPLSFELRNVSQKLIFVDPSESTDLTPECSDLYAWFINHQRRKALEAYTGYRLIKHLIGGLKLLLGINKRCSGEAENIKAIWTKCASALYRHKKVCDERITGRLKQWTRYVWHYIWRGTDYRKQLKNGKSPGVEKVPAELMFLCRMPKVSQLKQN